MFVSAQPVKLSMPGGSYLVARYLGDNTRSAFVPSGTTGYVIRACADNFYAIRFDGYDFDLVIPAKYLHCWFSIGS
jgi:hypothetical protein